MADLEALSHALLTAARAAGADAADALVAQGDSLSVQVLDGKLEHAERAEAIDLGLRVLIGQKQAVIAASDARESSITEMAERAVAMASVAPDDPHCGLADAADLATVRDAAALELADNDAAPEPGALQEAALEAEAAAAAVTGISKVETAAAGWSGSDIWIAATNGFSGGYRRTGHSCHAIAITGSGTGMERDYFGDSRTHAADLFAPAEIGRIAGERAAAMADPKRPPTGAFPILYDERISSSLIGHLAAAINGQSVARGSSWLKDAMGEQVLPEDLSITADPLRARVAGSKPFDGEGLPSRKMALVENGVLKSWVLDLSSARQLGLASTGHASRGAASTPSPAAGNLALTQGSACREDLIKQMGTGLLVTSMIGSTINPTTGDYSRGASGFWVENGEITGPVNECTIAGNLRDMLRAMTPANDARTHLSRVVPSLLVEGMTIAGA